MTIHPIIAENWKMDGGATFGVVPQTIWRNLIQPDENNMIPITSRCLLVEEGQRKMLFDTGMGNKQSEKYYSFRYLFGDHSLEKSLAQVGLSPDEITDVVFTHLHDDHCGGAIRLMDDGSPELVFKNAMHYVSSDHWHWANHPNGREVGSFFKINFQPVENSGQLTFIEKAGAFTDHIELLKMDGHTQGQLIPKIRFNEKSFVFTADFIPSAAHIPIPFIASVDIQPLIALKEKEAFLKEAVEQNYYLIYEHDIDTECCNLVMTEKGIRMGDTFRLNEILH